MSSIIVFPKEGESDPMLVAQFKFLALATPDELREMLPCPRLHQLAEAHAAEYFQRRFSLMSGREAEIIPLAPQTAV
jgi:hypothetical protein